jgi:integrase
VLPVRSRRAQPYPYTDGDIAALMRAARALPLPLMAATYETLIGLLTVTGMRVGEAIGADRADLELDRGVLVVRGAKFGKSREVPLHPSTVEALAAYSRLRDRLCPRPGTPSLFVSTAGTRLIYNNVHHRWLHLVRGAGLEPRSGRCRPRPHDLRHRFAVTTLVGWYRDGADVEARLPQLSTYLGHVAPSDTYWYLHAAPELLGLAARRLEAAQDEAR